MPRLGVGSRRVRARAPLVDEGLPEDGSGTGPHPSRRVARRGCRAAEPGTPETCSSARSPPRKPLRNTWSRSGCCWKASSNPSRATTGTTLSGGGTSCSPRRGSCSRTQPSSLACSWWPGAPIDRLGRGCGRRGHRQGEGLGSTRDERGQRAGEDEVRPGCPLHRPTPLLRAARLGAMARTHLRAPGARRRAHEGGGRRGHSPALRTEP